MKTRILPFFFLLVFFAPLSRVSAQEVTREERFGVKYPIQTIGYPSKIVPGPEGSLTYVEYWTKDIEHKYTNYYIQNLNASYKEEWFRPLTKENLPKIQPMDVHRLSTSFAVFGEQYSPTVKGMQVKVQMFELDGRPKGGLQTVSNYTKKTRKGFSNELILAPDSSRFLWLGHNPEAKAKKRKVKAAAYKADGRLVWRQDLFMPQLAEKYKVKQATIDKKGNAYFLLDFESKTNNIKDTVNLPIVLRWDHKEKKMTEYRVDFSAASVPECRIHITEKGDLALLGVLADGSEGGFTNGAKRFDTGLKWNKIFYKLFNIERELQLKDEYLMDIPAEWMKKYGEKGANFSQHEIIERNGMLYWIMEDFYTQIHRDELQFCYNDVATVKIDIEEGKILWASSFGKKQRNYRNGFVLSYSLGIAQGALQFVYLSERGAQGKIVCTSVNLEDGSSATKPLLSNERADRLFFPRRSCMVDESRMVLMGVGSTVDNDYRLIEITF